MTKIMPHARLLSRPECTLCDEFGESLAHAFGSRLSVDVVNVDTDPALRLRYGRLIPVLVDDDGRAICVSAFDRDAVAAWLAAQPV